MSQRGSANAIVPGLTSSPPEVRALDPNAPPPSQPDGDASSATTHTFKDLAEVNRLHDQAVESNLQLLERVLRDPTKMYSYGIHENVGKAEHPPLSPMESCVFKSGLSFLMGGALGGFLGLFMGSHSTVSFDPAVEKLSGREQMRYQLKQMRKATFSSAKNFAVFGMVYSGVECMIEKKRARADMKNAVLAGALTGGMFGMRGGPMATLMGASGMAAFSAAIEWYQHHM